MSGQITVASASRDAFVALSRAWSRVWFQVGPTTPLEMTRIGVGLALFINYAIATPHLFEFWGETGWMPQSVATRDIDPWTQSIFFYFSAPWQLAAFHVLFLFCCAALVVGWRTSWVKWIVLIGEVSYCSRNWVLVYGVDQILCWLLVVLCVAPIGRALSLDRVRAVRTVKRLNLEGILPQRQSAWAGACTRLIQIQMAVLFFYSGIAKIRGDDWWSGEAMWQVFVGVDYYNHTLLDVLAAHPWIGNLATYSVLLVELAFPFLIWQRSTRPYLLAAAIFLHVQIAVFMGMPYFSSVMIAGHMSFVRPEWLAALGSAWKRRMGMMEMIYDGNCGFCKRSMAWFLAFDGLSQISVRNFRTASSAIVSDRDLEKALYLVLADGRALPGFEAYRYVVLRVPGLWWLVPFFYVPVFSRLLGHPIYNWVAANRSRLSTYV
jgi:predicted DCC family thiol-disulfide oxidoreductase YuxK